MDIEEPAPYGGIMVKHLDDVSEQKERLKQQTIDVTVNDKQETLRPEAIVLKGVDTLATDNINAYVDYYINYNVITLEETPENKVKYEPVDFEDQLTFRIEWINDTAVNIVFQTHEQAKTALNKLSITSINPALNEPQQFLPFLDPSNISSLVQEREAKPYQPIIEFQKQTSLANRLGVQSATNGTDETMDTDETSLVLYTRISFQSDKKVKNAASYSRYYLLHGEPERAPRQKYRKRKPDRKYERDYKDDDDLFADKLRKDDIEDDLFADKLRDRDRSPTRD